MSARYSISRARDNLARLVHEAEAGEPVELTRRGRPVAVLMSIETYTRLRTPEAPSFWDAYQRFRDAHDLASLDIDPEEILSGARDRDPGPDFEW